jgi:hypothetical protein
MAHGGGKSEGGENVIDLAGELAGAALPGLGAFTKVLARGLRQEWTRNSSVALRVAERTAGCTREQRGPTAMTGRWPPWVLHSVMPSGRGRRSMSAS